MSKTDIPSTTRALVLPEPGKFEIRTVPVPTPRDDQVLCKIRAVAICGSDPEIIRGGLAGIWPPTYPFIPGHEWAGEVVAVGKDIIGFKVGDRVAGQAHSGCGKCRNCMEGRYNICENYGKPETGHSHYGFITPGAYAKYEAYNQKSINKMPDSMTFQEGSLIDTAGVALHGLQLIGVTPGGTVAVIGPGPIGLLTMRLARSLGAAKVIAIGRKSRLEFARGFADEVVDFEKVDPVKAVRDLTGGIGVDECAECSGAAGTFRQAVEMVRKGGKVTLLGVPPASLMEPVPFKHIVHDEITVIGSRANPNVSDKLINMIAARQLRVDDLVTHAFPLEEFGTALDTFVNRRDGAVKVVVEPNGKEE